jgi:hypothetical protein
MVYRAAPCAQDSLDRERGQPGSSLVILIQAESRSDGEVFIGYRPLSGGIGICVLGEVDLLDGPDETFR